MYGALQIPNDERLDDAIPIEGGVALISLVRATQDSVGWGSLRAGLPGGLVDVDVLQEDVRGYCVHPLNYNKAELDFCNWVQRLPRGGTITTRALGERFAQCDSLTMSTMRLCSILFDADHNLHKGSQGCITVFTNPFRIGDDDGGDGDAKVLTLMVPAPELEDGDIRGITHEKLCVFLNALQSSWMRLTPAERESLSSEDMRGLRDHGFQDNAVDVLFNAFASAVKDDRLSVTYALRLYALLDGERQ